MAELTSEPQSWEDLDDERLDVEIELEYFADRDDLNDPEILNEYDRIRNKYNDILKRMRSVAPTSHWVHEPGN